MAVTEASASPARAVALAERLASVRSAIATAARAVGRDPAGIALLPVSKTRPLSDVLALTECGGPALFGENRPQELARKAEALPEGSPVRFALIGHLQTNKAGLAARWAAQFQALDSLHLAAALDRRLQAEGRGLDVFIEVNTSGEAAKHGLEPAAVPSFASQLGAMASLRPRGLMTVALDSPDREAVAACFERLCQVRARLREDGVLGLPWDELSMGMSGDYELAIAHGATIIRLGTALFGAREPAPA